MKSYRPSRDSKHKGSKQQNGRVGSASTYLLLAVVSAPCTAAATGFGEVTAWLALLYALMVGSALGTRFRKTWIREFPSKRREISDALSSGGYLAAISAIWRLNQACGARYGRFSVLPGRRFKRVSQAWHRWWTANADRLCWDPVLGVWVEEEDSPEPQQQRPKPGSERW